MKIKDLTKWEFHMFYCTFTTFSSAQLLTRPFVADLPSSSQYPACKYITKNRCNDTLKYTADMKHD